MAPPLAGLSRLPEALQQRLFDVLETGETPVWVAQPASPLLRKESYTIWLVAVPWIAISAFMLAQTLNGRAPVVDQLLDFNALYTLFAVLAGLALMTGPVWFWRRALSTVYAITPRRVITIIGKTSTPVRSFWLEDVVAVDKKIHSDGTGDLLVRMHYYREIERDYRPSPSGLFAIANARKVQRLLEHHLRAAHAAVSPRATTLPGDGAGMKAINTLPHHLQQRMRDEFDAGETLWWVGQPDWKRWAKEGFLLWIFAVPWTLIALPFAVLKWTNDEVAVSALDHVGTGIVSVLLLIGLLGMAGPFWSGRMARSTVYAITNRRAFTMKGRSSFEVKSYLPGDMENIRQELNKDGTADLILRTQSYSDSDGAEQTRTEGFLDIIGVKDAHQLLAKLCENSSAHAAV